MIQKIEAFFYTMKIIFAHLFSLKAMYLLSNPRLGVNNRSLGYEGVNGKVVELKKFNDPFLFRQSK